MKNLSSRTCPNWTAALAQAGLLLCLSGCSAGSRAQMPPQEGGYRDAGKHEQDAAGDASSDASISRSDDAALPEDSGALDPRDAGGSGLRDLGNGMVYDSKTDLTWQQAVSPSLYSWADAKTYCRGLALAGGTWTLPTREQLVTIVVKERSPSIDSLMFPNTPADDFWSSNPSTESPGDAEGVSFKDGTWFTARTGDSYNVRCVQVP